MARVLGLANIKLGAIEEDGGMGETLVAIGDTVPGTCTFEEEEGTTQDFFSEELSTAIESIISEPGVERVNWSTTNLDADNLVRLFGGTKTTGPPVTYEPPASKVDIELSLEITDKKGNKIEFPRVKINAQKAIAFNKTALGQLNVTATVLVPTKENTAPWKITYAA